jgi:predicted enzyme related to lactoylglutathione lyase
MDVPNHGRLAFFTDPEGAAFAAWQSTGAEPVQTLIHEPGSLAWNELMCRDSAAAQAFYSKLFGWSFKTAPNQAAEYTIIRNREADAGGLMQLDQASMQGVPPHWMVYFGVADCAAATAEVQSSGGRVYVPPMTVDAGTFSVVADPQGGSFGLFQLGA